MKVAMPRSCLQISHSSHWSPELPLHKHLSGMWVGTEITFLASFGAWEKKEPPLEKKAFVGFVGFFKLASLVDCWSELRGCIPHRRAWVERTRPALVDGCGFN